MGTKKRFNLHAPFLPAGDQPTAIRRLVDGLQDGMKYQTLLGVTGSGKSLAYDEPIFLYRNIHGSCQPLEATSIGQYIEEMFQAHRNHVKQSGDSEVLPLREPIYTLSISPQTLAVEYRRVTALTRHPAPRILHRVQTSCGREVTVTGDHNFYALRGGRLVLARTRDLRTTDHIPLPRLLPPAHAQTRYHRNLFRDLTDADVFVEADALIAKLLKTHSEPAKEYLSPSARHIDKRRRRRSAIRSDAFQHVLQMVNHTLSEEERRVIRLRTKNHRRTSLPLDLALTDEWLDFLGLMLAEGHCHAASNTMIFASYDPATRTRMKAILRRLRIPYGIRPSSDFALYSKIHLKLLSRWVGATSRDKHLPPFWTLFSPEDLGRMLRAYFEGDGCVETNSVTATTASPMLIHDLQTSLLTFGIWARAKRRHKRAKNGNSAGDWYFTLTISGQENLRRFAQHIGFLSDRKQNALQQLTILNANTNVDIVPHVGILLRRFRRRTGVLQRELVASTSIGRTALSLLEAGKRSPSHATVLSIIQALSRLQERYPLTEIEHLRATLERFSHAFWTSIENVTEIPSEHPYVYDLTVEENETFFAGGGGLFVHNTFVMANVIQKLQRPALVLSHNKTLAAQLASEFREFFPKNAVHYFVSYYDYYQPEAYVPRTDTYIQKDANINDEIDRLRHAATQALLTRRDVIIVASVSCIYGIGSPEEYQKEVVHIEVSSKQKEVSRMTRNDLLRELTRALYARNDIDFRRGTFRVRGDTVDIHPVGDDTIIRLAFLGNTIERITRLDPLTGEVLGIYEEIDVYPAKLYLTSRERLKVALKAIREELSARVRELQECGKLLEIQRLTERTNYDLEMLETVGYVSGIENYSRHLSGRNQGEPPAVLLDYFPADLLAFIDESHMTLPQVAGMHAGDRSRKETLIAHGFRLPSALDNRPLRYDEFEKRLRQVVYVSATPGPEEHEKSEQTVELIVRPTGLLDPTIEIHPTEHQIDHLIAAIRERVGRGEPHSAEASRGERVLVTTLTKRMAEDLTSFLQDLSIKVQYLHSDVDTLERVEILRDLRIGAYDVLVGINLLREGLDLPEVSLVAILDADKEGYLRSDTALIQVMGRAARHVHGHVIMYADQVTGSMRRAIDETTRRRDIQEAFNREHGITPRTIVKGVREDRLAGKKEEAAAAAARRLQVAPEDIPHIIEELTAKMRLAAANLEFEEAARLRDEIAVLKGEARKGPTVSSRRRRRT